MDIAVEKKPKAPTRKPISKKFKAILEDPGGNIDGAFVTFPFDVQVTFGSRGQIKVKATFDGHPYRGILSNMGTGHHVIIVRKDVRAAIGKKVGDNVNVMIQEDLKERVVELPGELKALLKKNASANDFFNTLSFTNRKEYALWISSAKRPETKQRRLEQTMKKLLSKKKNPSEK